MQQKMPVFLFPTTIVFVDDDTLFLKSLTSHLDQYYLIKTFQNSEDCLKFFDTYQEPISISQFFETFSEHEFNGDPEHELIDLNYNKFNKVHQNNDKIQEVAVIIVDFNMPGKNGIELCEHLKELPVKKILLTAKLTLHEAVKALNSGVIDCYIDKDEKNLSQEIAKYIDILTKKYFSKKSHPLLNHFEVNGKKHLSDVAFIKLFEGWRKENRIKEYYLIDKIGNFMAFNDKGEKLYFIIHTKNSLDEFLEIYEDDEFYEFSDPREKIKSCEMIPFFGINTEPLYVPPKEWSKHFYPANYLRGITDYYWTAIKE